MGFLSSKKKGEKCSHANKIGTDIISCPKAQTKRNAKENYSRDLKLHISVNRLSRNKPNSNKLSYLNRDNICKT